MFELKKQCERTEEDERDYNTKMRFINGVYEMILEEYKKNVEEKNIDSTELEERLGRNLKFYLCRNRKQGKGLLSNSR